MNISAKPTRHVLVTQHDKVGLNLILSVVILSAMPISVQIIVNPGHWMAGVNSGTVPAIPGQLATLYENDKIKLFKLRQSPCICERAEQSSPVVCGSEKSQLCW